MSRCVHNFFTQVSTKGITTISNVLAEHNSPRPIRYTCIHLGNTAAQEQYTWQLSYLLPIFCRWWTFVLAYVACYWWLSVLKFCILILKKYYTIWACKFDMSHSLDRVPTFFCWEMWAWNCIHESWPEWACATACRLNVALTALTWFVVVTLSKQKSLSI